MSQRIQLDFIDKTDKTYIQNTCEINNKECFDADDNYVYLPLAFAHKTFVLNKFTYIETEEITFKATLRQEQINVVETTIQNLQDNGCMIISARPGFGKTIIAIYIASKLNVKTCIIVNKLILIDQWKSSIEQFTNSFVQYITSSTRSLDPNVSIYIVNAVNIGKKSRSFWTSIKFVIVDELHQIITPTYSCFLLLFEPNFILGLSATPYRNDEYNVAIDWFFGKKKIGEKLNIKHTVRIIDTGFIPHNLKYSRKGLDWNSVLNSQCENDSRNDIIVNNVLRFPDKTWLILVKRVVHADSLVSKFKQKSIKVETLLRSATTFDKTCKILIGTTSKIGVGFDHVEINALCLAADVDNYLVQFLGRCMRKSENEPLVLDFKDHFGPLNRHLENRKREYKKSGGVIIEE